ncbi:MAG TPA: hypothetical protein VN024_00655, partial [Bradyrhizobium sp.]|nr:hypothetical protein [Bradyrhizobium sp.]
LTDRLRSRRPRFHPGFEISLKASACPVRKFPPPAFEGFHQRGRPMEIDPLVSVVQEIGRLRQIPTPALDAALALVAQRAEIAGLHEGNVRPAKEKIPVFA